MAKAYTKRPLRYNRTAIVKIEKFYDDEINRMAKEKKIPKSVLLRRWIKANIHADLAIKKRQASKVERYETH